MTLALNCGLKMLCLGLVPPYRSFAYLLRLPFFMGFLCVQMCVSTSLCVSCAFSLALLFILSYSGLILFYLIINFYMFVCFLRREEERVWIWMRREAGRIWE